jgi:NAD(P)-dependent dehydrogenase (short-subunit alcohol dehydrogenase family)
MEKVALFAATGRLGIPVVKKLVEEGWNVALSYRSGGSSEKEIDRELKEYIGTKVLKVEAKISDKGEADRFVEEALRKYGRIDVLIGIASHFPSKDDFDRWRNGDITDSDWDYYDSNFTPIRNANLSVLERMEENPADDISIINFADSGTQRFVSEDVIDPYESVVGKSILEVNVDDVRDVGIKALKNSGAPNQRINPYSLSKRDISYLTKRLAVEHRGGRVRVNAIAPGPMLPAPGRGLDDLQPMVDITLLKRTGGTQPIVDAAMFFINSNYITGQTILADGGQNLYRVARENRLIDE